MLAVGEFHPGIFERLLNGLQCLGPTARPAELYGAYGVPVNACLLAKLPHALINKAFGYKPVTNPPRIARH
jgi:hypothetical protein